MNTEILSLKSERNKLTRRKSSKATLIDARATLIYQPIADAQTATTRISNPKDVFPI